MRIHIVKSKFDGNDEKPLASFIVNKIQTKKHQSLYAFELNLLYYLFALRVWTIQTKQTQNKGYECNSLYRVFNVNTNKNR